MSKHHILALWLASILLFVKVAVADQSRPITMACSSFPPFKIENPGKGPKGIDIDIMSEVFSISGREVDYSFYPWKRAVTLVEQGKVDGLCGCSYRPEREANFFYSDAVGFHSQGVFLSDGSNLQSFTSLTDLRGLSVATVRGYTIHDELIEAGINTYEARDDDELLNLLVNGRVDAIYSYRDILLYNLSHSGKKGSVNYREFSSQPYYFCFSKNAPSAQEIRDDINKALRTIRYNGTYNKIWKNYQ